MQKQLQDHSRMQSDSSNIFINSTLNRGLTKDYSLFGNISFETVIIDCISNFTEVEYLFCAEAEINQKVNAMIKRCAENLYQVIKVFCMNRSRQRRRLFHLIEQWEMLQRFVEPMELEIHESYGVLKNIAQRNCLFPISSWIYHIKMKLMFLAYTLGFELHLYAKHEYTMISL